ncbi:Octapeptide-repeat protein T2, partial [Ophiophagus hannah]
MRKEERETKRKEGKERNREREKKERKTERKKGRKEGRKEKKHRKRKKERETEREKGGKEGKEREKEREIKRERKKKERKIQYGLQQAEHTTWLCKSNAKRQRSAPYIANPGGSYGVRRDPSLLLISIRVGELKEEFKALLESRSTSSDFMETCNLEQRHTSWLTLLSFTSLTEADGVLHSLWPPAPWGGGIFTLPRLRRLSSSLQKDENSFSRLWRPSGDWKWARGLHGDSWVGRGRVGGASQSLQLSCELVVAHPWLQEHENEERPDRFHGERGFFCGTGGEMVLHATNQAAEGASLVCMVWLVACRGLVPVHGSEVGDP